MSAADKNGTSPQARPLPSRRFRLPLSIVLLVGFVGLTTGAAGSVLWLSLDSAQRSTSALIHERQELTLENVIGHMRLHLDQPREQAGVLADLIGETLPSPT